MASESLISKQRSQIFNKEVCWKWLVLVLAEILMIIYFGLLNAFGIIIVDLQSEFNSSMTLLTLVSTLTIIASSVSSFFPLWAHRRIQSHPAVVVCIVGSFMVFTGNLLSSFVNSPYQFFLTYIPFCGIGSTFMSVGAMSAIGEYFPRNSSYYVSVTTIILSSMPLGLIVFTQAYYDLIVIYGWRGPLVFSGLLSLIVGTSCACGLVSGRNTKNIISLVEIQSGNKNDRKSYESFDSTGKTDEKRNETKNENNKASNEKKNEKKEESLNKPKKKVLQFLKAKSNILASLLFLINVCVSSFYMGIIQILPHFLETRGMDASQASTIMTLIGPSQLVTIILCAILGKFIEGIKTLPILAIFTVLKFFGCLAFTFSYNFINLMICSTFFGVCTGVVIGYSTVYIGVVLETSTEIAWSFYSYSQAFGVLFSPLLTGLIYDVMKDYNFTFYAYNVLLFICFLSYCIQLIQVHSRHKNN